MTTRLGQLVLAACLAVPIVAHPAQVSLDGDTLVVSGELAISDERSFFAPFEGATIRSVRFEDCMGGPFGPADALRQLVEKHQLRTEAKGIVASGCAMAFIAGFPRKFVDNERGDTQLIFHGAFDRATGQPHARAIEQGRRMLIERTQHRIDENLARQMINDDDRRSTFRVVSRGRLIDGQAFFAYHCPFVDGTVRCEALDALNAENLGLVTPAE